MMLLATKIHTLQDVFEISKHIELNRMVEKVMVSGFNKELSRGNTLSRSHPLSRQ